MFVGVGATGAGEEMCFIYLSDMTQAQMLMDEVMFYSIRVTFSHISGLPPSLYPESYSNRLSNEMHHYRE